jgi:hypothetical protein
MRNEKAYERSHYRSAKSPAFPAQWLTTYLRALPGVHDLVSHRHQLDSSSNGLSTSPGVPGPHAFVVRARTARLAIRPRPSHPASRFVTIAHTPLVSRRDDVTIIIIFRKTEAEYFLHDGLTGSNKSFPIRSVQIEKVEYTQLGTKEPCMALSIKDPETERTGAESGATFRRGHHDGDETRARGAAKPGWRPNPENRFVGGHVRNSSALESNACRR